MFRRGPFETPATDLLCFMLLPSRLGRRVDGNNTARMIHRTPACSYSESLWISLGQVHSRDQSSYESQCSRRFIC
jgi:hypothetical protein